MLVIIQQKHERVFLFLSIFLLQITSFALYLRWLLWPRRHKLRRRKPIVSAEKNPETSFVYPGFLVRDKVLLIMIILIVLIITVVLMRVMLIMKMGNICGNDSSDNDNVDANTMTSLVIVTAILIRMIIRIKLMILTIVKE